MASNITLSAGVRQNLMSLQNTAQLMSLTQNRLATGKKVNSALDNPANFFTSVALQARSADLNSLLDSMSSGIKTLEVNPEPTPFSSRFDWSIRGRSGDVLGQIVAAVMD